MKYWLMAATTILVAGCETPQGGTNAGFIKTLPEGVTAVAAPYQNLNAVKINPADGCYVYRHDGPVESTLLPLRTTKGRPICTEAAVEPKA